MLSIDDDNLSKLKAMYEICDVVAAILSGIGGNMQIAQVDSLKDKLVVIDPFYSDCVKSFGKEKASEIYNFIRQTYLNNHLWANDYFVRIKSMLSDENKWEELQTWLSEMLDEIKSNRITDYSIFDEKKQPEIAVVNGNLSVVNVAACNVEIYKVLVNEVFSSDEYNGKISVFRLELATDVAKKVKSYIGEEWNTSDLKTYFNAIRHYVGGEQFAQPWTDVILSSITSVIIKGDDWEGMLRFMVSKGMCDYRYAFGLYGALNGFSNLTRDFTDILLASKDISYIRNVYEEIHRQLTGCELSKDTDKASILQQDTLIESNVGKEKSSSMDITDVCRITEMLENKDVKSLKGKKLKIFLNFYKESGHNIEETLNRLKTQNGWKRDSERLLKEFGFVAKTKSKVRVKNDRQVTEQELDFQSSQSYDIDSNDKMFDFEHIDEILNLLKLSFPTYNSDIYKSLKKDLIWVLNPQYDKSSSNKERIEKFYKTLKDGITRSKSSKKGVDMDWKIKLYRQIDIDAIIGFLHKNYDK